ncbi:S26 family signal peptidase [Colwellia sp. RSH04]|uniref:S26 family signal peptidase n=1 Tax=Colwellia sp. RSH04 TaxID=2305464 RepID=UPI000E589EFE|nr:S26 family signal peptidase [Colwellia sp. RSH04]RHW74801.1 S26 family signal peptidase [Colwellia sp. RSH04]
MITTPLKRFAASLLNILIPGAGLIALGYWRLAFLTQIALISSLLLLCFSRLIFSPEYIIALLIFTLIIYLVSTTLCYSLTYKANSPTRFLATALFSASALCGLFLGFSYKDSWLGVHLYFVPSMSMHPTLKPGQFILVDTWAYNEKPINLGDVVVFKQTDSVGYAQATWLVKRIANWPQGSLQHNDLFYLLGDNSGASYDSRRFGGIKQESIVGKVKLVLLGIDNKQHLEDDSWLQPVN